MENFTKLYGLNTRASLNQVSKHYISLHNTICHCTLKKNFEKNISQCSFFFLPIFLLCNLFHAQDESSSVYNNLSGNAGAKNDFACKQFQKKAMQVDCLESIMQKNRINDFQEVLAQVCLQIEEPVKNESFVLK